MPDILLGTTSPVGPLDDLAEFVALTARRSVIGLGEATHGTREAFELKHRLIRALAEHGGLTTVAFECGLAAGRVIDRYVRWGHGSAADALAQQGYWCWENHEVLAFVEWLRVHNAQTAPKERIAFVGIDVQKIESGLSELLAALEDRSGNPAQADAHARKPNAVALAHAARAVRRMMGGALDRDARDAAASVQALAEAAPLLGTPELRALCRNASRYIDTYLDPARENSLAKRDEHLATTVMETLRERPGLIVVWAHNEHVAVNPDFFGTRAMGHHLREALGDTYLALGMLIGEGAFLARSMKERPTYEITEFRVGRGGEGHVERCFAGRALGVFDAKLVAGTGEASYRRFLGNFYDHEVAEDQPDAFRIERPLSDFDLVAWLPEASAARYHAAAVPPT